MRRRGACAGPCVLLAATLGIGCEMRMHDGPAEDPAVLPREPLELSVDRIDIAHGGLRVSATMHEGSADVQLTLGEDCNGRDVGGGMATPTSLVWILGEDDVAGALGCDLEVVARTMTSTGYVLRTASLAVSAEVVPSASKEAPPPPSTSRSPTGMDLVFSPGSDGRRLSVGDSLVEASLESTSEPSPTMRFEVPHRDFARAILSGRPLRLGSWSFDPSVTVGGVALETKPVDVSDEGTAAGNEETEAEEPLAADGVILPEHPCRPSMQ